MAIPIQAHEDRNHALPPVPPYAMLAYLMETSGRAAKDLTQVRHVGGFSKRFRARWARFDRFFVRFDISE
jgi:hypothetical protein